jgi:predicted anti-sigma-YlaC factor YlaD
MKCEIIEEKIPMLVAGTLNREDERDVLNHLMECEQCRQELAFWIQVAKASKSYENEFAEVDRKSIFKKLMGEKTSVYKVIISSVKVYFKVIDSITNF